MATGQTIVTKGRAVKIIVDLVRTELGVEVDAEKVAAMLRDHWRALSTAAHSLEHATEEEKRAAEMRTARKRRRSESELNKGE